jgi:hypothetical protein
MTEVVHGPGTFKLNYTGPGFSLLEVTEFPRLFKPRLFSIPNRRVVVAADFPVPRSLSDTTLLLVFASPAKI